MSTGKNFPRSGKRYHPADFSEEERHAAHEMAERIFPIAQEVLGVHALSERDADVLALALSAALFGIDR